MSPPNPPELPPPVVNLDCTTNFMIVDTAPETTSCWFPDPPALLNNFIPSDIALLISCSLDPPLKDPPDVICLMTYKNSQRVWRSHRGKKGWTRLQGSSTADRLGAHSLNVALIVCLIMSASQFFIIDWFLVFVLYNYCFRVNPRSTSIKQRQTVSINRFFAWEAILVDRPWWMRFWAIELKSTVETDRSEGFTVRTVCRKLTGAIGATILARMVRRVILLTTSLVHIGYRWAMINLRE